MSGQGHNRFERARIIGSRALQISLGAPMLVKVEPGLIDPVLIAMQEYEKGVIPTNVRKVDASY